MMSGSDSTPALPLLPYNTVMSGMPSANVLVLPQNTSATASWQKTNQDTQQHT